MKSAADIISLTRIRENSLRPANLRRDLENSAGSVALLQVYAAQALQQPVLNSTLLGTGLGDLPAAIIADQAAALRTATYFSDILVPDVVGTLTGVLGFGSMVDAFGQAILSLLPGVLDTPSARPQVLALVSQLEIEARRLGNEAQRVHTALAAALSGVQADSRALNADVDEAARLIGSDHGKLTDLERQIADTSRKIDGEIAGVVVSALVVAGGGVVIGVGALATLPAGASGTAVVLSGVALVAMGGSGLTTAAAMLAADNARLAALYEESAQLSLVLTVLRGVDTQVKSLAAAAEDLGKTAGRLFTEWPSIQNGLKDFAADVTRASDSTDVVHLETALRLAQQDWTAIQTQVRALLDGLVDLAPQQVQDVVNAAA